MMKVIHKPFYIARYFKTSIGNGVELLPVFNFKDKKLASQFFERFSFADVVALLVSSYDGLQAEDMVVTTVGGKSRVVFLVTDELAKWMIENVKYRHFLTPKIHWHPELTRAMISKVHLHKEYMDCRDLRFSKEEGYLADFVPYDEYQNRVYDLSKEVEPVIVPKHLIRPLVTRDHIVETLSSLFEVDEKYVRLLIGSVQDDDMLQILLRYLFIPAVGEITIKRFQSLLDSLYGGA